MPISLDGLGLPTLKAPPPPTMPAMTPPAAPKMRDFGDSDEIRTRIYGNVLRRAQTAIPPIQNQKHTLQLADVDYADAGDYSIKDRKRAILRGETLGRKLRGTWMLMDNATGAVVDRKRTTLATVPYMTDHGTFIKGGNDYTLAHQMRLRPGVYTRRQENGELEAHVNVMPGKGLSHRIYMEPDTGLFRLKVGQANMPLLPVLKAMGVNDEQIRDAWGNELYVQNAQKDDPTVIEKLYKKLYRNGTDGDFATRRQAVADAFRKMELDEEVTRRNLGQPFKNVDEKTFMETTRKLIRLNKGEVEPDDRDHLANMTVYGPEDLIAERLGKDRRTLGIMLRKASIKNSLATMPTGIFTKAIESAITGSGLGQPVESINPAQIFEQQGRISRMGEGGIPSLDSVPAEARNVQPSHFGFIDPLVTPECFDALTYVLTDRGWKLWSDVTTADRLACRVDGRVIFEHPVRVIHEYYRGSMIGLQSRAIDYLVTPNHRILNATPKRRTSWRIDSAIDVYGKRRIFDAKLRVVDRPSGYDTFRIPAPPILASRGRLPVGDIVVPMAAWCRFMAWYIAEGWQGIKVCPKGKGSEYRVTIAQSDVANPQKCARIAEVLAALPWQWKYCPKSKAFRVGSKHLAYYLAKYGRSSEKYLPRYFYDRPLNERRELLEILMAGDGDEAYRYTTSSHRLALDVHELACEAGYSATINPMDSPSHLANPANKQRWRVGVCRPGREIVGCVEPSVYAARGVDERGHYREHYDGMVHCAEVPGGLLYIMRNGKSHWSGNSLRVGVDSRMVRSARKGDDGRIYSPFRDVKSGRTVYKSPQDLADSVIAFPNELNKNKAMVAAMVGGKTKFVPREQVQFELPQMEDAFSHITNLVPMKSAVKGQRAVMAGRMITQALPVTDPESPLVQSGVPGSQDDSYENQYGKHMGALRSDTAGAVIGVSGDEILVRGDDGRVRRTELYNNYPYNRKSVTGRTRVIIRLIDGHLWDGSIADYVHIDGNTILSIDPETKKSAFMPITGFIRHVNDKRLYRVRTASGREVDITEDHSLVTIGDSGDLVPIYPHDCVIGRTRLPIASIPHKKTEVLHSPNYMTRDRARLAGLYLSEGHLPKQAGMVQISVAPDHKAEEVLELLRRMGLSPYRNGGNVCFTDHPLRTWLLANFGQTSGSKFIGSTVFGWNKIALLGLIEGYFAGDGCLWADNNDAIQVTAVSTSERLRDGMINILSMMGVFATRFDAPRQHINDNWNDAYGLRVISGHLSRLPNWFFYEDRERKFRDILKSKYRASSFELVPVPTKAARRCLYHEFDDITPYVYKTAYRGAVAKERLKGGNGPFGAWGRSDVMWDTIESIEPIPHEEYVYDFSVAGSENFAVCNGLIVHNTYIHQTPTVRPGDPVRPGQLLARSNYTDANGVTALGKNARVAYIPFRGMNFEDAIVVSESFAKRMTSEHMYQHGMDLDEDIRTKKRDYVSIFPAKYDRKMLDNFDDDGVVKPGTILQPDDPIILAAKKRDRAHNTIHRGRDAAFADKTETWKHHSPGEVTDVEKTDKGILVAIKSTSHMDVGDKLSGRYGDKGVIAGVIPDHEMPQDGAKQPFEVLLNPLGIITRTNPAQMIEATLGKIAAKTGKAYRVQDFQDQDLLQYAITELMRNGMKDQEDIHDPVAGRTIPGVFTGNRFFMKLHHTAESKGQGRGTAGYTAEGRPSKGGEHGSKRISLMDINAVLSHGATEVLRDASVIRGQAHQDYWAQFMSGHKPPTPKIPFVHEKFVNQLKAAGINVIRDGTRHNIMALTDKDIDTMSGDREIVVPKTVDWKEGLKPVKGGLFDPNLTGGHNGNRWAHIKLHESMPNPVMEEPIRRMLGLTQAKFRGILGGTETLDGYKGPAAIAHALGKINVDRAIDQARTEIAGGKRGARDIAVRKLGYLKSAQKMGLHPKDWMLSKVPVLPPMFRPVSVMQGSKLPMIDDPNWLYAEVMQANDNLKSMSKEVDDLSSERLAVYDSFKAVTGLGDPLHPKNQERGVKGILRHVFGNSPKVGMVQRKLLGSSTDLVGRAVITPNPDLDMDTVGIPEKQAWEVYHPFIARRLRRRGMDTAGAIRQIKEQTPLARAAMIEEMNARPVIINRAPVLHRYGVMAFMPRLTQGDTLQVSPLIVTGFNADFDGDAMQYHVPGSDEAVDDAINKMLPSRNLLAASNFKVHQLPSKEYGGGLYSATTHRDDKVRPAVFRTAKDAIRAYQRGEVGVGQPVEIQEDR